MTIADPLLAELNGKKGVDEKNLIGQSAAQQGDPLDVAPAPDVRPKTAKMDQKHSIAAGGKGYRMVVTGEYYRPAAEGKGKVLSPYELSFNVPQIDGALGLIVGKLLLPALKKHYPEATGYRTHNVKSAEPLTEDTPPITSLQFMDRERLVRYIADNSVPINPAEYPEVSILRETVIDHKLNPLGFEKREAARQKDRKETAELMAMNPDVAPASDA